jgi:hypothetical protein
MSQLALAKGRLFDADALRVTNLKLFPGTVRETTAEQYADQINKALSLMEVGEFEEIGPDEE